MSLHDSLEADLKAIGLEGKKKNNLVKELTDKACADLRKSPAIPSDSILQVIESVKGIGAPKIYSYVISITQKLLNHHLIDSISVISVLEFLSSIIIEVNEESLQLKSLQTIMLVLNPQVVILTEDLVSIIWRISISLQNFKSILVKNTASAVLSQLVSITFEKLYLCKDKPNSFETKAITESSTMLINNVIELLAGTHAMWTGEKSRMKVEGVSLLNSIISLSNFSQKKEDNWYVYLEKIGDLVRDSIGDNVEEGYTNLCIQSSVQIILITNRGFEIVLKLANYLETKTYPDWIKISSLEGLTVLTKKLNNIENLYQLELLGKITESVSKASADLINQEDTKQTKLKIKLTVDFSSNCTDSIIEYCIKQGIHLSEGIVHEAIPESMINIIWKPLLSTISSLLNVNLNETQLQAVLNCYQNLVSLTGSFGISLGRESIISSLSIYSKPTGNTLNSKQIYCYKSLLNIAHGLHCVLDMKSWHRILNSLAQLDSILSVNKCEDELLILKSALESLFNATSMWPNASVIEFISALGQLTLEYMEALSGSDKKISVHKIFGLDKLIIVTISNISRVTIVWDMVAAYLDCICNSKSSEIRQIGISSLTKLLIKIFKHFVEYPPAEPEIPSKWKNWQKTLFVSLHDLGSQQEPEVYKGIYTILQSCGGQLDKSGWNMLLSILFQLDITSNSAIGYKCLYLIVNDFLQSEEILSCFDKLAEFISKFAYSKDINQSISAVGMYWNLADFLGRSGKEAEDSWWLILGKLKELGQDTRPEVRHSALHSLHVALSTHGSCLSKHLWERIMENVVLSLLQKISSTYFKYATLTQEIPILEPPTFNESEKQETPIKKGKKNLQISIPTDLAHPLVSETPKFAGKIDIPKEDKIIIHHSRDTLEKQWEETYHIFTQNLGKLFRTYLSNLEKYDEDMLKHPTVKKNWDLLILRLKEGLHNGTTNIITAVLKAVKELISCSKVNALFFAKWNSSWEIMTTLCNRLQVSNVNIPHKLIIIILEDLSLIYTADYQEPFQEKCMHSLYLLLNALLEATKLEGTLSNCRILPEQKEVFDFLDKLFLILAKNKLQLSSYLRFVLRLCKYDAQDSHSDAICRKALTSVESIASQDPECLNSVINEVLSAFQSLLTLRFDNECLLLMNVTCKGAEPLYYIAAESFLKVMPNIMKLNCWDKMLEVLEELLLPDEKVLARITKTSLEEVIRTNTAIDIQIIEFVKEQLIPASMAMPSNIQWKVIGLLDNGCDNYYQNIQIYDKINDKSFPFACLSGLFELCKAKPPKNGKEIPEDEVYYEIAKKTIPVLINRCKDIIKKFAEEEKILGIMPLSKNRLQELLKLLEMLKNFEMPSGIIKGKGNKPHLEELFLPLCDLIIAKEIEVKEALREVFIEFSKGLS